MILSRSFILLSLFSLPIFCANSTLFDSNKNNNAIVTSLIKNSSDNYFGPLTKYQIAYARFKTYNRQEPVKETIIDTLEKHFEHRMHLEKLCAGYYSYQATQLKNKAIEQEDLMNKFWETKNITYILRFKSHYEELDNQLKTIQSQFETIKLDDPSHYSSYNPIIQELINAEIEPLKTEYKEAYDFDLTNIYNNQKSANDDLNLKIDWEKSCRSICINFLKKISGATSDNMGHRFFDTVITIFVKNRQKFVNNNQPNSIAIQLFFESIIVNNPVFSGCVDYFNSLIEQKYPEDMRSTLVNHLISEATQYYTNRLEGTIKTEPDAYLKKIQQNAMATLSIQLSPIIKNKLHKKWPQNQTLNEITEIICTSIFSGNEYKNYLELMEIINEVVEYIVFPVNSESVKALIEVALCRTPDAIKAYKKRVAQEVQTLADLQSKLQKEWIQYNNNKREITEQFELLENQLLNLSKNQQEIDQEKETLTNESEKFNKTKSQLDEKETKLNNTQTQLIVYEKKVVNRETDLQALEKKLSEKEETLNTKKAELNAKEIRLNHEEQRLAKIRFQLKMILYTVGVVATFLFIVTLIQKKYQFIS